MKSCLKVFNFLYVELSVAVGDKIPRFGLWTSMATRGANPICNLTSEKAADYLKNGEGRILNQVRLQVGEKEWARLVERVRRYDPDKETPEEIMERLCDLR